MESIITDLMYPNPFVGRNVILGMDRNELFRYKVDKNAPLPIGGLIDKLVEE